MIEKVVRLALQQRLLILIISVVLRLKRKLKMES
jgi:hypothetical protein